MALSRNGQPTTGASLIPPGLILASLRCAQSREVIAGREREREKQKKKKERKKEREGTSSSWL